MIFALEGEGLTVAGAGAGVDVVDPGVATTAAGTVGLDGACNS
jgi:hypothetical protein